MNILIPATPESLTDSDDVMPPQKIEGLQRAWALGEKLPWKGILFTVCGVSRDRIVLAPVSETAAHAKKRKGRGA